MPAHFPISFFLGMCFQNEGRLYESEAENDAEADRCGGNRIYRGGSSEKNECICLECRSRGQSYVVFLIPYLIIGWDIVYKAFRGIKNGQVFDENFLMTVATFGAFGVGEFSEAVAVMLFYQVGELFQSYAVNRSRQSISDLMNICPEYANIEKDGQIEQVDPDDVEVDDIIVVHREMRIRWMAWW